MSPGCHTHVPYLVKALANQRLTLSFSAQSPMASGSSYRV